MLPTLSLFEEKGPHILSYFGSRNSLPRTEIFLVMILLKTTFSLLFEHYKYLNVNTKRHQECNLFCVLIFGHSDVTNYSPNACFSKNRNLSLLEESWAPALT